MSISEKRQIENEMIFRKSNEKVGKDLKKINSQNIQEGNSDLALEDDLTIHFVCECSDENCQVRVPIKLKTYQKIHENRKAFVLKPDHYVIAIEKIILTYDDYVVVEKYETLSNPGVELNDTPINNT